MITTKALHLTPNQSGTIEQSLIGTELKNDGKIGSIVKHDNY